MYGMAPRNRSIYVVREAASLQSNSKAAQKMTCIFKYLLTKLNKYEERIKGVDCQFRRRHKFSKIAYLSQSWWQGK
jgi:hypothetical protein